MYKSRMGSSSSCSPVRHTPAGQRARYRTCMRRSQRHVMFGNLGISGRLVFSYSSRFNMGSSSRTTGLGADGAELLAKTEADRIACRLAPEGNGGSETLGSLLLCGAGLLLTLFCRLHRLFLLYGTWVIGARGFILHDSITALINLELNFLCLILKLQGLRLWVGTEIQAGKSEIFNR